LELPQVTDDATLAERLRIGLMAVAAFVRGNDDAEARVDDAISAVDEAVARIAELKAALAYQMVSQCDPPDAPRFYKCDYCQQRAASINLVQHLSGCVLSGEGGKQ
jgi:hypothetical protein